MNEVFLMGKIITEIKFDFLLNNNKKSITRFYIETLDEQKIKIIGHDEIADFCYSRLNKGDSIFIYGMLNENGIIVRKIIFLLKLSKILIFKQKYSKIENILETPLLRTVHKREVPRRETSPNEEKRSDKK